MYQPDTIQRLRPRIACCRQGARSPAASARIHPVLPLSSPSKQSKKICPADTATRSWRNSGRIRAFTSRNEDAKSSSVASTDAAVIHDLPIMEIHGFGRPSKTQLSCQAVGLIDHRQAVFETIYRATVLAAPTSRCRTGGSVQQVLSRRLRRRFDDTFVAAFFRRCSDKLHRHFRHRYYLSNVSL